MQNFIKLLANVWKYRNKSKAKSQKLDDANTDVLDGKLSLIKTALVAIELDEHSERTYQQLINDLKDLTKEKDHKARKVSEKAYWDLLSLAIVQQQITVQTKEDIVKLIQRCKHVKELEKLRDGYYIRDMKIPSLDDRFQGAANRDENHPMTKAEFDSKLERQATYLKRKQTADNIAFWLTVVVSLIGVGVITGIAMMAILPMMPAVLAFTAFGLAVAIPSAAVFYPALAIFVAANAYVEYFVFSGYMQRFCRQCVRGFFKKIDDHIINREAKKQGLINRRDLDEIEQQKLLAGHPVERAIKKGLALLSVPLAMAAGVGFAGLIFSETVELLTILGVVSGTIAVAAPFMLPVVLVVGALYGLVMYSMIYGAIKNNIFASIRDKTIELFAMKNWKDASTGERAKHLLGCFFKLIGFAAVLAISVAATVFTAGAWLDKGVTFFTLGLGVVEFVAEKIAFGIAAVYAACLFDFSLENSLKTANDASKLSISKISNGFKSLLEKPKNILKLLVNSLPFFIHLGGAAALAGQGSELAEFEKILGSNKTLNLAVAVGTEFFEEGLVDGKEALIEPLTKHEPKVKEALLKRPEMTFTEPARKHGKDGCASGHGHSHGDLWSSGKKFGKFVSGLFKPSEEKIKSTPLRSHDLRPYTKPTGSGDST